MIRIGPAGWVYDDWKGVVYPDPPPSGFDPLTYLASYFDTIEVNSSFYGPPKPATAVKWARRVGGNGEFRFTAKLWRRFTHQRKEAWTRAEVREVRNAFDPLHDAGRLGAVLLQFPWSFRNDETNRAWLEDVIGAFDVYPLTVEIRHSSWNHPDFFTLLRDRSVGFVNIDQPLFSDSIGPSATVTSPIGYVRVHGRNYRDWWRDSAAPHERYDYLYTADELTPWVERVKEIAADEGTDDVYVVTNNHYRGKAVANALMLESMSARRRKKVPGPPELFEEYGDLLEGYARPERTESEIEAV